MPVSANYKIFRAFIFSACLLALSCDKTIQVGGRGGAPQPEQPAPLSEQQDFNQQMQLFNSGKIDLGIRGLEGFLRRHPQSRLADDALYQIGVAHIKTKRFAEAAKTFQRSIENYPTADTALLAKYYFGVSNQKIGNLIAVLPILETVNVQTLPAEFQLTFLELLRDGYRQQKQYDKVLSTNLTILEFNPTDLNSRTEVLQYLDGLLSTSSDSETEHPQPFLESAEEAEALAKRNEAAREQLERLADTYGDNFPADFSLIKLARYYWLQGDFNKAKTRLQTLLSRFRDAGKLNEHTREAEEILARIERIGKAQPGKVGVLLPLSGSYEKLGRAVLNGILLGSGLLDAESGDEGLQLVVRDSGMETEQTLKALDELITDQQVVGVIGPLLKKPSAVVAKAAASYNVPVVLLSQEEGLVGNSPFVFQNCLLKSEQVKALVKFALVDMNIKRVAMLYPNHVYGQEMFWLMWDEIKKYPGVEVRAVEAYEKDVNDFSNTIRQMVGLFYLKNRAAEICSEKELKAKQLKQQAGEANTENCYKREELPPIVDFEALFIPESAEKVRQIAPTLSYYGIHGVQLFGGNLWNTPELLQKDAIEHLQGAIFVDGFSPKSQSPNVQIFMNRYRLETGETPDILTAQAYDTMVMFRMAQKQGELNERDQLRRFLKNLSGFNGATGATSFAENGQAQRQIYFFMVDGNQIRGF